MCDFVTPNLLYYSNVPPLIIGFLLGAFVLFVDRKSVINRNIFYVISVFWLGTLNSMMQWITHDKNLSLFLSRMSVLEFVGLLFFTYFTYAFSGRELNLKKRIYLFLPFTPMFLLLFSNENSFFVDEASCSVGYGLLYFYMYLVAAFYMLLSIRKLVLYIRSDVDQKVKKQVGIINRGITFMVLWVLGFVAFSTVLINYGILWGENLLLFIPYGLLIFISILTYAITRYQFLRLRLLTVQALTYAIWILIGSMFFFIQGSIAHLLVSSTLLLSVIFGIFLIRSVKSEVKRKEELQLMADKLAQANDQLRKLDNAKTEFISIASHQLRTPLTAIKGFLSLVLEGSYGEVNKDIHGALDRTYSATERLIQLVEDLLNVSRIEAGRMEFKFEKADIQGLLEELYENFIMASNKKKLSLELKEPKVKIPEILMDRSKIREVLSNIIDNAIKYTDKGGVVIRTELLDSEAKAARTTMGENIPSTEKGPEIQGDVVRVTVSDTGIGIPAEEMPYLFKKFSRGKDISRLNAGGTGLGIYVGKSIMESHHGRIWVESKGTGMGSRFIIELPIS